MKQKLLSLAACVAAAAMPVAVIVSRSANAVEDPPTPHYALLEAESMAPATESYNSNTAGSATQSSVVRTSLGTASGQAYSLFDNRNADQSRLTLPFEVEWPDTYAVAAGIVKAANFGIVKFAVDGRSTGAPIDGYAAATTRPDAIALGTLELSKGKHTVTLTVTGKNDAATDYRAGLDFLELDSEKAGTPAPSAVDNTAAAGSVDPTLGLTLGASPSFGAFTPGTAKDYTAQTTANVISTAGDATLSVSDPGHLVNGTFSLSQRLSVTGVPKTWSAPVSNDVVTLGFKQSIGANDPLRSGSYTRTLTFTLSTTNP
jgi:hypothetical protein